MGGALLAFVCAGAYFVAPVDSASAAVPIAQYVSTQETYDGVPNNYVINLVEGSNAASVKEAARIAGEQGGVVLTQYPQFASLTVQAAQAGYSQKLAQALASAGIRVHSIAPTHEIAVEDSEIVVPNAERGHYIPLDDAPNSRGIVWNNTLEVVKAVEAQNVDVPLEPVSVAVIDTGIAGLHPKLRGKIDYTRSVDCTNNGKPIALQEGQNDSLGHGTQVAGIIASEQQKVEAFSGDTETSLGVYVPYTHIFGGIAPKNVTLVDIKVFNAENVDYPEDLTCAYTWAAEHNIDITNASLGDYWNPNSPHDAARVELLRRAVSYASSRGVVHVAGAGNDDVNLDSPTTLDYWDSQTQQWYCNVDIKNSKFYPAMFPDVITVSAMAEHRGRAVFAEYPPEKTYCGRELVSASNWGKNSIDVTAPGVDISSTFPSDDNGFEEYSAITGTSAASPHVAGVLALLKGIHPDYTPQQLRALLYKHAEQTPLEAPSDGKEYRGHGLVNALLAVTKDQPKPSVTVEYSTDGGKTWKAIQGAVVDGRIDVRVRATGPVTRLVVTGAETGTANGDGSFSSSAEVRFTQTVTKDTPASQLSLKVQAYGRNNDSRADDDVVVTVGYFNSSDEQAVYRLYSPRSGEHLFTTDVNEYKVLPEQGWKQEGIAWIAPKSGTPLYRLYSPVSGDHLYTIDTNEMKALISGGWRKEGVVTYSGGQQKIYRQFTPQRSIGSHNYTGYMNEYETNNAHGWKPEGVAWYALRLS